MSNDSEELIDTRPGDRPRQRSICQPVEDVERGAVAVARLDFRMNKDVRVNRLHELTPIHEIEQLVTIQEVNAGLLGGLPASKPQAVWFCRAARQRASKKVVGHRLQGTTLLGGYFL